MIWSVSTLLRRSGIPTPVCVVKASIVVLLDVCAAGGRWRDAAIAGRHGGSVAAVQRARRPGRDRPGRRGFRAPRWRRRPAARPDGCGRPCPAGPRSSGSRSTRCARRGRADPGSCPGTSSIRRCATRRRRPLKTASRPSASACALTRIEPGTTSIRSVGSMCRPRRTSAAARRSSIRPLVQDPRNTVSTWISRSGVPAVRPMYSSARSAALRSLSSAISSGSGTTRRQRQSLTGIRAPGDERRQRVGVDDHLGIENRVVVGGQRRPVGDGLVPLLALGAWSRPLT